jgi:hypothetical protein
MFLKDLRTYVRLQFLALVESLMSSPQPSNAPYLFPLESRPFDVDNWADYALREDFYALSTSSTIKKVTQRKATTAKGHEFVDVEIQTPDAMTFVTTDRGPSKNNNASSSLPSALPPSSRGNSCKVISFRPVPADDSVWVPQAGSKACLDLYTFSTHGEHNEICTLTWQDENLEPKMSVAQLAVLLRAIHGHSKQYIADSNSCYWHAFTVVEVIRGKFSAVQTNGTAFSERGMYKRWKPDLEDAVQTVSQLYDAAWEKCVVQAQERAVSSVDLPFVCFIDPRVC